MEIDVGPKSIILLHGYGGNKESWSLVVKKFPKALDVQTINLIGFGTSPPPVDFSFRLEDQAKNLAERFSKRDSKYTLVAHSMGAAVSLIAALDYGLAPEHLILVDPLIYKQDAPFFISAQTIPLLSKAFSWIIPPSIQVDIVLRRIYKHFDKVNPALRQLYIDEFKKPFHRFALRKTAKSLRRFDSAIYEPRYAELDMKISIVWSRDDPLLDFSNAEKLKNSVPDSTIIPIDNCGHAPHEECPDSFMSAIYKAMGWV